MKNPGENVAASASAVNTTGDTHVRRNKRKLHTDERARLKYEALRAEREVEKKKRSDERERRISALIEYQSTKRKMQKALAKRNRRGQPNLNAQIEVLLEKIEKRCKKDKVE